MLTDPQTVTINAIAIPMPATTRGDDKSAYKAADGNTTLSVAHTYGKRTRRVFRIDVQKIAADPLTTGDNLYFGMSCYVVVDVPKVGYTPAEAKLVTDGFLAYLTASSGAKMTQFLGGES